VKTFKFKLAAVETLREREENAALQIYARALKERQAALERRDVAAGSLAICREQRNARVAKGCFIQDLLEFDSYLSALQIKVRNAQEELDQRTAQMGKAFNDFLAARQQLEVVTKFRERERSIYDFEQRRGEQKLLDELSSTRGLSFLKQALS
jgi:flagellar export protein FliJ